MPGQIGIGNNDDNPNRKWPRVMVEREQTIDEFNRHCNKVANQLLSLIAAGLKVPQEKGGTNFFKGLLDYDIPNGTVNRLLYYPPLPPEFGPAEDGYTRINAHSDIGFLTLLFQHSIGGLYVKNRKGQWDFAPPRKGHIIINLGEELQVLSSGYLHATPHKVVATNAHESNTARLSLAYFTYPTFDLKLVPWEKGTSPVIDAWKASGSPNAGEDINWNGLGQNGQVVNAMELLADKYCRIYGFTDKWKPENVGRGRFATGPIGAKAAQALAGSGRL